MTYPDIAQALQARILENAEQMADTPRNRPDELRSVGAMEVQNAILEEAVATADALGEQRRQEAASAAKRVEILEAKIATLKEAVVKGEAVGEQQRQEAQAATNRANELVAKIADMTSAGQAAAKRIEILEANVATLEEATSKAEDVGEKRRQEAQAATKRADDLVAELIEMTSELVEMSKRMAEQTAAKDKMRTDFEDFRSRSWWWQHATG